MLVCESYPKYLSPPQELTSLEGLKSEKGEEADKAIIGAIGQYKWYRIVFEYTSKKLTKEQDKLVALSGVARQFAACSPVLVGNYWAGIWDTDLCGLLWSTSDENAYRPLQYRAPTWSWASLEGRIDYPLHKSIGKVLVRMSAAQIDHVILSDQFSAINSGVIPMQGRLISVQYAKKEDGGFGLLHNSEEIENSTWWPDEAPAEVPGHVLCLAFYTGPNGMCGLTVEKHGESSDEYSRNGVFSILPESSQEEDDEWIYPYKPFAELWEMDLDDEDVFDLV